MYTPIIVERPPLAIAGKIVNRSGLFGNIFGRMLGDDIDDSSKQFDYCRFVFTTSGRKTYTLDSSNMLQQVRPMPKSILDGYRKNFVAVSHQKPISKNPGLDRDVLYGVYVIEAYRFTDSQQMHRTVAEFYRNPTINTYGLDTCEVVYDELTTKGENVYLTRDRVRHDLSATGSGVVNIVHFFPDSDFSETGNIYHEPTGLLIGVGEYKDHIINPASRYYREQMTQECNADKQHGLSGISVTHKLINNRDSSPHYVRYGTEVLEIIPVRNAAMQAGATITLRRDGDVFSHITIPPEDFEKHGIFKTKELALASGSPEATLKLKEYELRTKELTFKHTKLDYDKDDAAIVWSRKRELEAVEYARAIDKRGHQHEDRIMDITERFIKVKLEILSGIYKRRMMLVKASKSTDIHANVTTASKVVDLFGKVAGMVF